MSQSDSKGARPPHPPHHPRKRATHPGTRATGSCDFPLGPRLGVAKVYQKLKKLKKLKKLAPQSEEMIAARELIKAAVIKKRD